MPELKLTLKNEFILYYDTGDEMHDVRRYLFIN